MGLGLLVLGGAGIAIFLRSLPVYEGTVAGVRVPSDSAIAVTVPWLTLDIPPHTQQLVIEYFERKKTSLTNTLMKIDIGATSHGLVVQFETTAESMLIRVDPSQVPDIKALMTQYQVAWDASRKRELTQFAQELCANVAKAQAEGTSLENISNYHDVVALNALVRGLGRHCVAVAHKIIHPCVFEDEQGQLFFVVPRQATELLVVEKHVEGRTWVLPAEFRIHVRISTSAMTPHVDAKRVDDSSEMSR